MKTLFSRIPKNRFSGLLLPVAILLTGMIFLWFIWHITEHNDMQMSTTAHQHSIWFVAAIILVFAVFLAAYLTPIRALHKSHEILLVNNAELKRTEEALRQSEAHYRIVTESASDAIITIDQQHTILFVNSAAEKIFGYKVDEMLGNKLLMLIPEHLRGALDAAVKRHAATGKRNIPWQGVELPALHKDGHEVPIEVTFGEIVRDGKRLFTAVIRDITGRKRAEEALRESEYQLRTLVESMSEGIVKVDNSEKIEFVNDSFCEMTDFAREELIGKNTYDILFDEEGRKFVAEANRQRRKGISSRYEMHLKKKSGEKIWVIICGTPLINAAGIVVGTMAVFTNMTERKRAEEALQKNFSLLTSTFEATADGILVVDRNNNIVTFNQRFIEMWQIPDEIIKTMDNAKAVNCVLKQLSNAEDFAETTKRLTANPEIKNFDILEFKDGKIYERYSHPQMLDGKVVGRVLSFRDITEHKRAEEQLLHDAFHDGLTGLANRTLFMDHLRMTIERSKSRHSNFYAVLFLDFDRFKVINDSLGHAEGDNLLKQVARRLESSLRTGDLVARLGGDKFVILLSEMLEVSDAIQVAERIQEDLKNRFDLDGAEIFMSASIGIALSTDGHKRAEDMLRDADIAMYRAKARGKARYQVFDQAIHARATTQLQLETEMRQALERREFELHYQPIINLKTNELAGFEALVRWKHPERGMVLPGNFIPAAEENGLIIPLGRWILGESCRQLREWQDNNLSASALTMSVNLSCKQFLQSDLAEQVVETLKATGLAPRLLKLEITESYLIENNEKAVKIMNHLRALGVELSFDDFGTGYSSLSYLHRLPVNNLKIDRSFVSRMTESEENSEIVHTIIKLAQNLKMKVIAEGIETADQLAQLNQLNCGYGQGYFFSKPLEAEKAAMFINENVGKLPGLSEQPTINLELNM